MIDQGKTQIGADMADIVSSTSSMLEARASDFAGRMEAARHVVSRSFDTDIQRLADARHCPLIEHRDLHRSTATTQSLAIQFGCNGQRIRPDFRRPKRLLKLIWRN